MNTYYQRFKTLNEKLEEKVERIPECGCWLWTGGCSKRGYGKLLSQHLKEQLAHRISWILNFGEIPKGACVLHRCDTPSCVNPYHLFLGTKEDNNRDRENKGRGSGFIKMKGEIHNTAKLKNEDVINIRHSSERTKILMSTYGVSKTTIQRIRSGKTWKCLMEREAARCAA